MQNLEIFHNDEGWNLRFVPNPDLADKCNYKDIHLAFSSMMNSSAAMARVMKANPGALVTVVDS